jgi:hypothetical protein
MSNPYQSPSQENATSNDDARSNSLLLGVRCGCGLAAAGFLGVAAIIVAQDVLWSMRVGYVSLPFYTTARFWSMYGFPPLFVVPLAMFTAGLATYAPRKRIGFARTLALLCVIALPMAGILGALGMSPPRYRSISHPPMYWSEVLMYLVSFVSVTCVIVSMRWGQRHDPT